MDNPIRWIVLIQKAPKGPFTTTELESLIEQGLVRRNDVAFQMLEGSSKAHSGWKFIWQFAEFERRVASSNTPPVRPHEPEEDRRHIGVANAPGLPTDEISAIQPDDLVLRTRRDSGLTPSESLAGPTVPRYRKRPLGWLIGGAGIAGTLWYLASTPSAPLTHAPGPRTPASVQRPERSKLWQPKPNLQAPVERAPDAPKIVDNPPVVEIPKVSTVKDLEKPVGSTDSEMERLRDRGLRDSHDDRDLDRELASEYVDEEMVDEEFVPRKKRKRRPVMLDEDAEYSDEVPEEDEE